MDPVGALVVEARMTFEVEEGEEEGETVERAERKAERETGEAAEEVEPDTEVEGGAMEVEEAETVMRCKRVPTN